MTTLDISMFCNIGSLTLGAGAWALALAAMICKKKLSSLRLSVASLSLCSLSLFLQLLEVKNRATAGDFSAIEDTVGAVVLAAIVLISVTAVLNIAALIRKRGNM